MKRNKFPLNKNIITTIKSNKFPLNRNIITIVNKSHIYNISYYGCSLVDALGKSKTHLQFIYLFLFKKKKKKALP